MSFTVFQNEKTPFQAIKTRSSKSQKIAIILNELTHCFCTKIAIFQLVFVFLSNIGQENVFYNILEQKNAFLGQKKQKVQKVKKIDIFRKGLTHGFGPKIAIFPTSFFQAKQARKMSFTIFWNKKNASLAYKNKKFKNSKYCHFSKGVNSWFWSKKGHFFNFFFLANIGQENVFDDILERKKAFLGFKNEKFENSKIGIFPKRLTHGFGPKMVICPTSFFQEKQAR